jgi:hypothetical protein
MPQVPAVLFRINQGPASSSHPVPEPMEKNDAQNAHQWFSRLQLANCVITIAPTMG